ncbi:hypothetical protein HY638_00245 [Candidatus Woesearchaeota archaeon]|nr:hypothetical protein [Candidatus Woesearchaeota archaeon]
MASKKGIAWERFIGLMLLVALLILGILFLAQVWDPLNALKRLFGI